MSKKCEATSCEECIKKAVKDINRALFVHKVGIIVFGLLTAGMCVLYYLVMAPLEIYFFPIGAYFYAVYTSLIKQSHLRELRAEINILKPSRR